MSRWAERTAWPQLQDIDGTWLSSGELEERSRLAAGALLRAGLSPGDGLVLSAGTSADMVVAYVGALRAGVVVVPVNAAYTEPEVLAIARDARPAAAVFEDPARGAWLEGMCPVFGLRLGSGRRAGELASSTSSIDLVSGDDPALLIYTSGTTGRPKGAQLTHANLLATATAVELAWRWSAEDRLLLTLPLFHVHGLGIGLNGTLAAGASVVLRPRFDPAEVASVCGQGEISMFFGVPAMYQRLTGVRGATESLRGLRLLVSGSAPLPAALSDEIAAAAGQVPLERYGMTETGMLTSNPYEGLRAPGTVGFPLPGVDVRLSGSGEVEVRGPNVITGYYKRPDATAEAFTDDGWFRTGDLGEFDSNGYLRLVGRSKELIITGGYNVYPREVEEALATHPAVSEVAVVGRASDAWGEEVTAVVVLSGSATPEELRTYAAERLAPYKVPKLVEFASSLPRNALGKVLRGELK